MNLISILLLWMLLGILPALFAAVPRAHTKIPNRLKRTLFIVVLGPSYWVMLILDYIMYSLFNWFST